MADDGSNIVSLKEVASRLRSLGDMVSIDEKIGDRIRIARLAKGLTQAQLAASIGDKLEHVQSYERGSRRPKPKTLINIANALRVQAVDLFPPSEVTAETSSERVKTLPITSARDAELANQVLDLAEAFMRIDDPAKRKLLVELAMALAPVSRSPG